MDLDILIWINNNWHGVPFINHLFKYITYLGEVGIIWIITALTLLIFKKTRKCGIYVAIALLSTLILNNLLLKNLIARPRPFAENVEFIEFIKSIGMDLPGEFSFPSGHTFSAFSCATIITLVFKKKGAYAFIPATIISFSRVFLCVHYVTDVLGGAILGVGIAFAIYYLCEFILKKLMNKKTPTN